MMFFALIDLSISMEKSENQWKYNPNLTWHSHNKCTGKKKRFFKYLECDNTYMGYASINSIIMQCLLKSIGLGTGYPLSYNA